MRSGPACKVDCRFRQYHLMIRVLFLVSCIGSLSAALGRKPTWRQAKLRHPSVTSSSPILFHSHILKISRTPSFLPVVQDPIRGPNGSMRRRDWLDHCHGSRRVANQGETLKVLGYPLGLRIEWVTEDEQSASWGSGCLIE